MTVLVIGATGILRPAVSSLVLAGTPVVAVARGADAMAFAGDSVTPLPVDASDPRALAEALGHQPFSAALVYAPAVGLDSLWLVRTTVTGRVVVVLTSASADTGTEHFDVGDLGRPMCDEVRLLLGWHGAGPDIRWHTPAEVSEAALAVLADGQERILGSVRPWRDRPS